MIKISLFSFNFNKEHAKDALELSKLQETTKQQEVSSELLSFNSRADFVVVHYR